MSQMSQTNQEKYRVHEVIAQAFLDADVSPEGDLVIEMSYGLYGEFRKESDNVGFWNIHGIYPELDSPVIREYREKFAGVSPRVVCRTDLKGDDVVVTDVSKL